jgi:hypothetical protein
MIYWLGNGIVLTLLILHYARNTILDPKIFWSSLLLKLGAGIILGIIYQSYYGTGDTLRFFELASDIADQPLAQHIKIIFSDHPITSNEPRVDFFVRYLSLFARLTGGSYWLTSVYCSLVSFIASLYAVHYLIRLFAHLQAPIIVSFLFLPSVVFWTSGITKESMAYAALLLVVLFFIKFLNKETRLIDLIVLLISSAVLWKVKHYLLISGILFGGGITAIVLSRNGSKLQLTLAFVVVLISFFLTQCIHPFLNYHRAPLTLFENNKNILDKTSPEKRLPIRMNQPTWSEVVRNLPIAAYYGLLKPNILDKTVWLGIIHRIENFILLALILQSLFTLFIAPYKVDIPFVLVSVGCILFLTTFLALSSPNFGSLVRYKSVVMPFYFLIVSVVPYMYFFPQPKKS